MKNFISLSVLLLRSFNSTIIAATLMMFLMSNISVQAEIYSTDAVSLSEDLNITIKNMNINGTPINLTLTRYEKPSDPWGLYWKYEGADIGLQMQTVHKQTFVYDESEPIERHKLDIYYTDHPEQNRVILFVPGGAWRQGDKSLYEALGNTLAGYHDFTVVVVNYRLSSDDGGNALHPDHISDVARAFAWVKQNIAPYGKASKISLFGQSAGAHLVSLLATDGSYLANVGCATSDIKAVISMSGSYYLPDFVSFPGNPLGLSAEEAVMYAKIMQDAFGGSSDAELVTPSPQAHIHSGQPPFLVIYTYGDLPGFRQSAEKFVKAVKALEPEPQISLRGIEFFDYTDEVWKIATEQTDSSYAGHWAEMIAINTNEPVGYVTKLIVEFFQ
ncbi:MAG: alpha/beta hydrolase [Desulfamplus sp.]|nr:alpha/beta hydrolase [Desulfamplus sp.]